MNEKCEYIIPTPVLNKKENDSLEKLTERYNKLTKPSIAAKTVNKIAEKTPEKIKNITKIAKEKIDATEIYQRSMELISSGFKTLEEQASKYTISPEKIIKKSNAIGENKITSISEICLLRSYDIEKLLNKSKMIDRASALVEGTATGVFGFAGIPFNIVLSTLLEFRAVQEIALYYGYDVLNEEEEMIIAGEVFTNAISPSNAGANNDLNGIISKVMTMTQSTVIKQTAKKGWSEMAAKGGIPLLLTQMRALAHKSAQKALEKAGQKGLEKSVFKEVFEQVGKRLTLKTIQRAVPIVSGGISGLMDLAMMDKIVKYSNIFYQKRFILEKEGRIEALLNGDTNYIDVEFCDCDKHIE